MEKGEVIAVLGYFGAAWPEKELTEATIAVWADACQQTHPLDAETAMRRLVKSEQWFPSIARFLSECEACSYRRHLEASQERGLPAGRIEAVFPVELVASMRAVLAKKKGTRMGGGHKHDGPGRCPVCGGAPVPWWRSLKKYKGKAHIAAGGEGD